MRRPFTPDDAGRRFTYCGSAGSLEYPLDDPGTAKPGEGILWFDEPRSNGSGWEYVAPLEVDPEGWVAEGTPAERHTPGSPVLTALKPEEA